MGVIQNALRERGLEEPDGRPLYQYRFTNTEYQNLAGVLKTIAPLANDLDSASRLGEFPQNFVLYAAEWWRRCYDGSGFSWEPILGSIGADPSGWSQAARSQCITRGFRWWRIELLNSRGLRFLGSVALQGGLPLSLLASAHGKIGQLLKRVLHLARNEHVTQNTLEGWVDSLQHYLPQTYRRPEIIALLADMAWSTLQLSKEAGLTSAKDAVAVLDRLVPQWRGRFPLPMEDQHAQALLEQLIREASVAKAAVPLAFMPVERHLDQDEDKWSVSSQLLVPEELPSSQITTFFGLGQTPLPRTIELGLDIGGKSQHQTLRKMADRDAYRGARSAWGFSGVLAAREHVLTLTTPDGRHCSAMAARGGELDVSLPWVFVADDGKYKFVRQGGGKLSANEALVLLPPSWTMIESVGEHALLGSIDDPLASVVMVSGDAQATSSEGLEFKLHLGRADAQEETIELAGTRSWHAFTSPTQVFRGQPHLYRVTADGKKIGKVEGSWTIPRTNLSGFRFGPLQLRYPASGDLRYRSRILVLPPAAELIPEFRESRSGILKFKSWELASAKVLTDGVQQRMNCNDTDLILEVNVATGLPLPQTLDLELRWAHTSDPVRLTVPFPVQGVRAFNRVGTELQSGSSLAVQHVAGVRLRVAMGQQHLRSYLEIELGGKTNHKSVRRFPLYTQPGVSHLELRLIDYIDDIQQLFSADETTDARVHVTCKIGNHYDFRLSLARYAGEIELEDQRIVLTQTGMRELSPETLAMLPVCALRLEAPAEESLTLSPIQSENVPTGAWDFSPAGRDAGSWLVYPGRDSSLPFRPTLCPVTGQSHASSDLTRAFAIATGERFAAIDAALAGMAMDYSVADWQDVEQLATQIGHLPLPTLDLWKCFAHSPRAMVALALRLGKLPLGFLDRFANELTFAWELVPLSCWSYGIRRLEIQCERTFAGAAKLVFEQHLNSRIDGLSASNGAVAFSLGIASSPFINKFHHSARAIKEGAGLYLYKQTHHGNESDYMKLRQRHAEDVWPETLFTYVKEHAQKPPFNDYFIENLNPAQYSVVNVPIFLALEVATGTTRKWFLSPEDIHPLRTYIAFDRDWFVCAFNHTLARALSERLISDLPPADIQTND